MALRVVFMGTGDIGLPSLRALAGSPDAELVGVVTQPDRPVGRRQEMVPPRVKVLAGELGLPVQQPERLRDPAAIEALAARFRFVITPYYASLMDRDDPECPIRRQVVPRGAELDDPHEDRHGGKLIQMQWLFPPGNNEVLVDHIIIWRPMHHLACQEEAMGL